MTQPSIEFIPSSRKHHDDLDGVSADDHHAQSHNIASHSDTTATGAETETLTDGSDADSLHTHSGSNLTGTPAGELGNTWGEPQVDTVHSGSPHPIAKYKTATETVNDSDTLQNDDHFSFSIGANEKWVILMSLSTATNSITPDFKFKWSMPSGGSYQVHYFNHDDTGNTLQSLGSHTGTPAFPMDGANHLVHLTAVLINSSTPGTAQFQWAQNVAHASDTQILQNSHMLGVRV